jgi:two-component system, NtrC family, sensor histidine kinase PilS
VPALWALMVTDVLIETGIVHYSGGAMSQFSLVFGLTIIAAAMLLQIHGGLGIALLASVCYTGYGALEAEGIISPAAQKGLGAPGASAFFVRAYFHVSMFFVVGAVSGYLAQRAGHKGRQLERARTKLKQLRVDTDRILEHMSSGVLVVDSRGRILTANPTAEQILGVDKNDVTGLQVEAAFETLMPEFAGEILRALETEQGRLRHEITVKKHDHSELPLGLSITLLKDEGGIKRGVIVVFKDLTDVRAMEERMRKADRLAAIGELSAGIAHEIRNPLASISGSIEMLYHELELSGDDKRLMQLVMQESDRLNRIINDFLEFARLRPPTRRPVCVSKCLGDVLTLLGNNPVVKSGVDIEVRTPSDLVVEFDEEQMRQVMLNLAINACEAMGGSGKLVIETKKTADGGARIDFQDEGCGIGDEVRAHLFEPFFSTKEGGTGLGLAIANKIVEAHGGRIEARNRTGGGAEFSVVFPMRTSDERVCVTEQLISVGAQ